jgi:RNA polymerase sigma-70 factor (ECF subfamily)
VPQSARAQWRQGGDERSISRSVDRSGPSGDSAALGRLLELYRNYLRLVARSLIGVALRVKAEPSDLVQETFLKVHREFAGFAGQGEPEVIAWLRRILGRTLADHVKHHRRKGRDLQRQESPDQLLERSDAAVHRALASHASSPSNGAVRREQAVLLADAVDRVPPDYREVFILRALEHIPLEEIAARIGRSVGAVRMLWTRALERLNKMLETQA